VGEQIRGGELLGLLPRLLATTCGLDEQTIIALQSPVATSPGPHVRILLLCDGLDELQGLSAVGADMVSTLCGGVGRAWPPCRLKVVFTSREGAVGRGPDARRFGRHVKRVLLPFTTKQVRFMSALSIASSPRPRLSPSVGLVADFLLVGTACLSQILAYMEATSARDIGDGAACGSSSIGNPSAVQGYQSMLDNSPSLRTLLRVPYVLKLFMAVLPSLQAQDLLAISRYKIYNHFLHGWLVRSVGRLGAREQADLGAAPQDSVGFFELGAALLAGELLRDGVLTVPHAHLEGCSLTAQVGGAVALMGAPSILTCAVILKFHPRQVTETVTRFWTPYSTPSHPASHYLGHVSCVLAWGQDTNYLTAVECAGAVVPVLDDAAAVVEPPWCRAVHALYDLLCGWKRDQLRSGGAPMGRPTCTKWDADRVVVASSLLARAHALKVAVVCPLLRTGGTLQFLHTSVFEFLCARCVLLAAGGPDALSARVERTIRLLSLAPHTRRIQCVPEVLKFLGEYWNDPSSTDRSRVRQCLLEVVAMSAPGGSAHCRTGGAGANAATILNWVREPLCERAWDGVVLDGADLSGAFLSGTSLRGASLRDCLLERACLERVNLRDADVTGMDIGERAPLLSLHPVISIAWHPRQSDCLFVGGTLTVACWELRRRAPVPAQVGGIRGFGFHPSNSGLVWVCEDWAYGDDADVLVLQGWIVPRVSMLFSLEVAHSRTVTAVALSPCASALAYAARGTGLHIREFYLVVSILVGGGAKECRYSPSTHVTCLQFDGGAERTLVTGHADGSVHLWDVALEGPPRRVCHVHVHPSAGAITVVASCLGAVVEPQRARGHQDYGHLKHDVRQRQEQYGQVQELQPLWFAGAADGSLTAWNPRGEVAFEVSTSDKKCPITSIAACVMQEQVLIATGGEDGVVHLWDGAGRPVGSPLTGHGARVAAVAFSHFPGEPPRLASASSAGIVRLWDSVKRWTSAYARASAEGPSRLHAEGLCLSGTRGMRPEVMSGLAFAGWCGDGDPAGTDDAKVGSCPSVYPVTVPVVLSSSGLALRSGAFCTRDCFPVHCELLVSERLATLHLLLWTAPPW
jgi:WD40 repeat protein